MSKKPTVESIARQIVELVAIRNADDPSEPPFLTYLDGIAMEKRIIKILLRPEIDHLAYHPVEDPPEAPEAPRIAPAADTRPPVVTNYDLQAEALAAGEWANSVPDPDNPEATSDVPFDWEAHKAVWNQIAAKHDLPEVIRASQTRVLKLKKRLKEHPDFWGEVEAALAVRNQWARDKRFPHFDQILEPRILNKLLEGIYRDNGAAKEPQDADMRRVLGYDR